MYGETFYGRHKYVFDENCCFYNYGRVGHKSGS